MSIRLRKLRQGGDTIVEVLFALIVIGIVLTGGYSVVTHSILDEQDAQEHSYALGLVQSQIEQLRAYVLYNPTGPLLFTGATGCMSSSAPVTGSSSCTKPLNSTENYLVSIKLNTGDNVYNVTATWPSLILNSGSNKDSITVPYRIELNGN
jgi:type II secretory pathway pseudopilin PulG